MGGRSVRRRGRAGTVRGQRPAAHQPALRKALTLCCRVPTTRLLPASVLRVHGLCLRFHELRAREPCCVPKGQVSVEPCAGHEPPPSRGTGKGTRASSTNMPVKAALGELEKGPI